MKLFAVYGDEWLSGVRVLLGIYDTEAKARKRADGKKKKDTRKRIPYNQYTVSEIELNKDIDE